MTAKANIEPLRAAVDHAIAAVLASFRPGTYTSRDLIAVLLDRAHYAAQRRGHDPVEAFVAVLAANGANEEHVVATAREACAARRP